MKARLIELMVMVLCLAVGVLANGQVSRVHLGWSQNDVYETMTVMWHSPVLENQYVIYDLQSRTHVDEYEWHVDATAMAVQPTIGTGGQAISTTALPGYTYRAELVGLEPGVPYYFRVVDEGGCATEEWWLRTIEPGQAIRFTFAGDSQRPHETPEGDFGQLLGKPTAPANWPFMRDFLTQQAAAADPDFMLALGDLVARGNNPDQWENWLDAWQEHAISPSGRMIPIVPVVGNHDVGDVPPNADSSYEWMVGQFAMPQSVPGLPCYSLDFPGLHLTVLAATGGHLIGTYSAAVAEAAAQIAWLENDLAGAGAQNASWRLVAFHYNYLGCFAPCSSNLYDVYPQAWSKILQDFDVDMVFMGHTHNYTRTWPVSLDTGSFCSGGSPLFELHSHSEDGITYVIAGIWGGPTNSIVNGTACSLRPWIAAAASHPAMGLIELTATTLSGWVHDTLGELDSFQLPYVTSTFDPPDYTETIP